MNIGVIGLGKLGLPTAEVFVEYGHTVDGYDIRKIYSDKVNIVKSIQEAVSNKDIVFVAVPTPHDSNYDGKYPTTDLSPKDFDYTAVENVIREANKHMKTDQILVLISTVLPGTIRERLSPHITNTKLVYNPYFIAMGSVKYDLINPDLVILGNDSGLETEDILILKTLYQSIIKNKCPIIVSNWDECECIKVFYNTFISTKVSFVNMIQDVAERLGNVNVDNVTNALCKSTERIISKRYMKAGMGDGGACHPRDNIALRYLAQKLDLGYDFFGSIMHSREMQAKNLSMKLVSLSKENSLPIVIHGKTYKPEVPYTDGSYSILVGFYCDLLGVSPTYVDPLVEDNNITEPSVILLAHSNLTTYNKENEIYCNIPNGSIVVDMWRNFVSSDGIEVYHYGNTKNPY